MRATAFLAITATTFVSYAAIADVKRHALIPDSLRGSWALSTDGCENASKSIVVVSADTYSSAEANCRVVWVSETAGARGAIYSAHLQCSKPGENAPNSQTDIIFSPKDNNRISIGSLFSNLKDYQRCATSEPAPMR
jgi:hypothetical protein